MFSYYRRGNLFIEFNIWSLMLCFLTFIGKDHSFLSIAYNLLVRLGAKPKKNFHRGKVISFAYEKNMSHSLGCGHKIDNLIRCVFIYAFVRMHYLCVYAYALMRFYFDIQYSKKSISSIFSAKL